jgi:hypothetical protein
MPPLSCATRRVSRSALPRRDPASRLSDWPASSRRWPGSRPSITSCPPPRPVRRSCRGRGVLPARALSVPPARRPPLPGHRPDPPRRRPARGRAGPGGPRRLAGGRGHPRRTAPPRRRPGPRQTGSVWRGRDSGQAARNGRGAAEGRGAAGSAAAGRGAVAVLGRRTGNCCGGRDAYRRRHTRRARVRGPHSAALGTRAAGRPATDHPAVTRARYGRATAPQQDSGVRRKPARTDRDP